MGVLERLYVQSGFAVEYAKFKRVLTAMPTVAAAVSFPSILVIAGDLVLASIVSALSAVTVLGAALLRLLSYVSARKSHIESGLIYLFSFMVPLLAIGAPLNHIVRRALETERDRVVAGELALILRDVEVLGLDPITALMRSAERVPSQTYREMVHVLANAMKMTRRVDLAVLGRLEWLTRLRSIRLSGIIRSVTLVFEAYLVLGLIAPILLALIALMLSPIAPLQIFGVPLGFEDILLLSILVYVPIINVVFYIVFDQILRSV